MPIYIQPREIFSLPSTIDYTHFKPTDIWKLLYRNQLTVERLKVTATNSVKEYIF
jgi:hypothetical protein